MSIFVDKPIEQEEVFLRFYKWEDPNKGWGDAGTYKYMEIPTYKFSIQENEAIDGSSYYKYSLDAEYGKELFGDVWWMKYGYELSSPEEKQKEINELQEMINQIS